VTHYKMQRAALLPGLQKLDFKKFLRFQRFLVRKPNTKLRPKSTRKHPIHILLKTNLQWAKD